MSHRFYTLHVLAVSLLMVIGVPAYGQQPATGADDWKYDVVYRIKGEPFKGLVQMQDDSYVDITLIVREPGKSTRLFKHAIPRKEVERVELLDAKERAVLLKRVAAIRKGIAMLAARANLLDPDSKPMTDEIERPTLKPVPWPLEPNRNALCYESGHFRLIASTREDFAQNAAIELEHFYSGYANILPPRTQAPATTILLTGSLAEYQALIRKRGGDFLNPAFFDVAKNQVVCGNDLERLFDQLGKVRSYHAKCRKELADEEADLKVAYKNKVPQPLLERIEDERNRIKAADARNTKGYIEQRRRLLRRLYHEAFHAYLNTFVYPPEEGEMPRWLNEGLAQICEAGIFEADGLRMDHAEKEQVDALRQLLTNDTLPTVAEVLKSGPRQFLVAHSTEKQMADRFYIASWGLAHYLTFNRHVLGTKAMDEYVRSLKRGTDPVEAFTILVDQPLFAFQRDFRHYLNQLQPPKRGEP